jgi:outer membrane lipoprotein-sorting protein
MFTPTISALLLLAPSTVAATGAEWLARVDAAASPAQDTHVVMQVSMKDAKGREVSRTMEIWQKGADQRLVRLTDPPRLAGVGLLVGADDVVHLYLPSYDRTRRVIGDQRGDAFMGTDISMEDLARTSFAEEYTAELVSEGEAEVELMLTPIDPKAHSHARSRLVLRASDQLWTRLEHLDAAGEVLRRVSLSDFREVDGYAFAHTMRVEDLERQRDTTASAREVAFDGGLDDELFTVTNLSRP